MIPSGLFEVLLVINIVGNLSWNAFLLSVSVYVKLEHDSGATKHSVG